VAEKYITSEALGGTAVPREEFKAAIRTAQAVEHQRLSAAIQASSGTHDPRQWCALASWQIVITLSRETFERHPRTYQDHLRYLALRDAADAIARAAIGEA
jgi:hypothetical protein